MLSEHLFFITERINDILELEKERKVECSDEERIMKQRITISIQELRDELILSQVVDYVRDVEQRPDEQQLGYNRFYLDLRGIANSSDHILNSVFSNDVSDDTADVINNLADKIRSFHQFLPSTSTNNYDINIVGNTNGSGSQQIITYDPSPSRAPPTNRISRPKTYGHVPNRDLVGFNLEIETLLTHLLQQDETHVVGIVGMGGAGKTTLAKEIYHHPQIKTYFTCKVWVCISQSWNKTSILNSIYRQATPNLNAEKMDDDQVVEKLYQHLSSESYLVILDDIWSIDAWNYISPGLPHNSGSKVVVTTRNIGIPKCIDLSVIIIEPKQLTDEQSLELFKRKTFTPNENISHVLQQLGEEMVQKCKGLPLAITALAGISRMVKSQSSWERINKMLVQSILNMEDDSTQGVVKEILGLSYYELPHYLKPCVLYLRLFPKDYEINSEVLMKMWIAECFIEDDQISTAEVYLDEMVQRCIIEVVETDLKGQVSRFRIHDLIRQVFVDIGQQNVFLKNQLRLAPSRTIYGDKINNSSSSMSESQSIPNLERISGTETNSQIRSVILIDLIRSEDNILQRLFGKCRLLRVLRILHASMPGIVMPKEIGNLIHLRYLELGGFIEITESIGNLVNLWTLDIKNIVWDERRQMYLNLGKLKELRHLYFPKQNYGGGETYLELEKLKKLKTLCYVNGGEWLLSKMPVLSSDLHELHIYIHEEDGVENSDIYMCRHKEDSEENSDIYMYRHKEDSEENSEENSDIYMYRHKEDSEENSDRYMYRHKEDSEENSDIYMYRHKEDSEENSDIYMYRHKEDSEENSDIYMYRHKEDSEENSDIYMYRHKEDSEENSEESHEENSEMNYEENSEENHEIQLEAVFRTPSITSNNLQTLQLIWNERDYVLDDMNILSKCKSLDKLMLKGAIKVGTPILFPPNLMKLEITAMKFEDREMMNIISNSCPLLKILTLGRRAYMGSELVCNANSFLQLEKLTLQDEENLKLWIIKTSAMPRLQHLMIEEIHDLDVNPEGWTFISNIPQVTYFGYGNITFAEKLQMYRKDDQNQSPSSDVYVTR